MAASIIIKPNVLENTQFLKLHPGQMIVSRSGKRFKVVVAGRRWGKTHYSATNIIKEITRLVRRANLRDGTRHHVGQDHRVAAAQFDRQEK